MIDRDTVAAFVAQVEAGDFLGAIERFYASDASMQENQAEPRRGRDNLLENERQMLAAFPGMVARRLSPILIDGDLVAIRWHFTMTPAEGPARELEEVSWQTWRDGRIVEERFFYDPRQMAD